MAFVPKPAAVPPWGFKLTQMALERASSSVDSHSIDRGAGVGWRRQNRSYPVHLRCTGEAEAVRAAGSSNVVIALGDSRAVRVRRQ